MYSESIDALFEGCMVHLTYVYRVDDKELLDAPGLFATRSTYQATPVLYKWQRAAKPE